MANRLRRNQRREPVDAAGVGAFLAGRLYNRSLPVRLAFGRDELEDLLVDRITNLTHTYRLPRPPEQRPPVPKPSTPQPLAGHPTRPGNPGDEELRTFYHEQMELLADVGTDLWRLRQKIQPEAAQSQGAAPRAFRHLESIWDTLNEAGFSIQDFTHQAYQAGDRLMRVVAEENVPAVGAPEVLETIRPAIIYKKHLIQTSDVIVAYPSGPSARAKTGGPAGEDNSGRA
jgi:hypothetical protein